MKLPFDKRLDTLLERWIRNTKSGRYVIFDTFRGTIYKEKDNAER